MNMKKLHLFIFTAGMLSYIGAGAQNASGSQPMPKPQMNQNAPGQRQPNPHTPPAPGSHAPANQTAMKPGAPAGKLLDSVALSKEPVFTAIDEAMKSPAKVYKLILSGDGKIPDGIQKLSNLQYLEINGPEPQRPMMPQMRADMPDDVPPPPMPMAPPSMPAGKGAEIGEGVLSLANLTELHLHNLGISKIPADINKLTNLKVLDLNSNAINTIPESISAMKSLKELRLNDAMVQALPAGMSSMGIVIFETGANAIPELKNLRELYLNNRNPNLPSGLDKLTNLAKIVVESSMVQSTTVKDIVGKLPNIREVDFPNAFMKYEDFTEFGKLPRLEKLEISGLLTGKSGTPRPMGFGAIKSLKVWNVYGQKDEDYRNIYQVLTSMPGRPSLTIKYRKICEDFLKGQKDLYLYVTDTKITIESMMALQPRGLIFGAAFKTLPSELLTVGSLQDLDLSRMQLRDYNQLGSALQKARTLRRLAIPSDALRFIIPSLNELKGLDELVIKSSTNMGGAPSAPADGREKSNLYKMLPKTKIIFQD